MKITFKYFTILVLICSVSACNNTDSKKENNVNKFDELKKASWLIGKWEYNSNDGNATEIWEEGTDSTLVGKSYFVLGKDTVSSETISIEQAGNKLFYIPIVKDQNSGQPVKFTLTSSKPKHLVFENPKHDFPQEISYKQLTKDSLLVEISGRIEGNYNSQQFQLIRVK